MAKSLSITEVKELTLENTVRIILKASVQLECTIITRTKALLIYHHFKRCVHEVKYDDYLVAAACLSLSIKFNEEPVEFDAIICTFFNIIDATLISTTGKCMKMMRKSLGMMECLILRMTEFSLNHHLAHEYLAYCLKEFEEVATVRCMWDVLVETSIKLSSDFYLSKKCINYKAVEIACSVIHATLYLMGFDTNDNVNILLKNLNKSTSWSRADIIEEILRVSSVGPILEKKQWCEKKTMA